MKSNPVGAPGLHPALDGDGPEIHAETGEHAVPARAGNLSRAADWSNALTTVEGTTVHG